MKAKIGVQGCLVDRYVMYACAYFVHAIGGGGAHYPVFSRFTKQSDDKIYGFIAPISCEYLICMDPPKRCDSCAQLALIGVWISMEGTGCNRLTGICTGNSRS